MKRLTYEFIKEQFEKEGWMLRTTEYKNCEQKLDCICPRGHRHSISYHNWKYGWRCPYCAGQSKPTIEFIRSKFEKDGCVLLTKKYINNLQKLEYICPKGHKHSISWANWQAGKRCPECYYLNKFGSGNPSWKGGISCELYCDAWADKEFKESIKERDGYTCQNPDCWQKNSVLTIHHIDYDKQNCGPKNLITLCNSCNSRANKDREWHTSYYTEIVRRRGLSNAIQLNP